jgi:hypothetical protein
MKIKVQLIIESDNGNTEIVNQVEEWQRDEPLQASNLGLTLAESKQLLKNIQQTVVEEQINQYQQLKSRCSDCDRLLLRKGSHSLTYRTLFGTLKLNSSRLFNCDCQKTEQKSFSPLAKLLLKRTSPERLYLESKFASLMSYGLTVKLLEEILPLEGNLNAASVRNNLHAIAQKVESELGEEEFMFANGCEMEWSKLPRPDLPITVGIDGGYIHSCSPGKNPKEWFEVIVGKSITDAGEKKCFGGVTSYDQKPKRRLFEVLKSQGMQMNQQVTFLSDGGDNVRELQLYLNPQAEHLLDWFHITMRITVMKQMAKDPEIKPKWREKILKRIESIKWYLWHGNVFEALQEIESLEELCYGDYEEIDEDMDFDLDLEISPLKLLKKVEEFQSYIEKNANSIPNYGERYRCGERIASSFVESTVNQVVSKRFVKKQQMRWSKKGAHLLLQVRNLVINQELRQRIDSWYGNLTPTPEAS